MRIHVAHIIPNLNVGGAEMMLMNLLRASDRHHLKPLVISLTDAGVLGEAIMQMGVPLRTLKMRPSAPSPAALWRLSRWLQQDDIDIVQTWMYHANLLGGVAAWLAGGIPVVWSIHSGRLAPGQEKRTTIWLQKLSARLSGRLPRQTVFCSRDSQAVHRNLHYDMASARLIPNGFDLDRFYPSAADRAAVRAELGLEADSPVIGYSARWHPLKGHATFIRAAGRIHQSRPDVRFVLFGTHITPENDTLMGLIREAGITPAVHLLGRRDDVPRLLRAFDLLGLASDGEAFPLAVGEAMASGVPCVVTDVGDSAWLVAETGAVVPPGDPAAFAEACCNLLAASPAEHQHRAQAVRQRIAQNFNLEAIAARYQALYRELTEDIEDG
jgi:glycosyltransferase involved in cell wall biosynthesis